MNTIAGKIISLSHLQKLPSFAAYLLSERLEEYVDLQLQFSFELEIPLLKYFLSLSEEQRYNLSKKSTTEFLTYLAEDKATEQIETSLQQWKANQLPVVDRDAIIAEDITLVNYMRKSAMLHFVTDYTQSPHEIIELTKEIDFFIIQSITASTNLYIDLFKKRIEEDSHFIQKVAETIPGAVYVFDTQQYKGIYSNNKLPDFIGYHQSELNDLGEEAIPSLVHPDDQQMLMQQQAKIKDAKDGEVLVSKYRIKTKDGKYKWLANYESVFKHKEDGTVLQTIGITLDINAEEKAVEELHQREHQLLEAQNIAQLGNYYWDFKHKHSTGSEKTMELMELEPGDFENFLQKVHPDDRDKIQQETEKALQSGTYHCEYRIVGKAGIKVILARGKVEYENGQAIGITGTVIDVTEKQMLIQSLRKSESLYKQAEKLANMGNWIWDVEANNLSWTDQLYRIYGLEPQSEEITMERFLSFIHPNDRAMVEKGIDELTTEKELDYTFRIITHDGVEKWLRSLAQVIYNKDGKVNAVIGIEQDVTEKQVLIARLQESEQLYKQAQSLTHMGNWMWDFETNKTTWSDELFAIYEMPKGEPLTQEEWNTYLDPLEKENLFSVLKESIEEHKPLDVIHKLLLPNGKIKVVHRKGQIIYNADGRGIKMIGTTQDITEQNKTSAELKESQTFIQKITDATPSIIASYNINTGIYTFISEGIYKLLGYNRDEVMKRGVAFLVEIIHPDDVEMIQEKNSKALEEANAATDKNDIVIEFTYRMKHANGDYRWFHTYGTIFDRNAAGKVEHILNISLDVTDQHEAIETIKEQDYFIQQIADASPTILYLFDVATQSIAYINREAFFVLGYLPQEIVEAGPGITTLLYHPEDMHLLPGRIESKKGFQQKDSMIQYECRMKHKNGEYCWLLVREIVFKTDGKGAITQIIGAALDINRRKEMEKTILQNTLLLEQSNASLEEFAYIASHDLKEPLRKISTFGDRLVTSEIDNLSEEGKSYLRKIVEASHRMQAMISDLLSISLISGNKQFEIFSLQKILEETLQTLEYKIEQQDAVIRYDTLPEASIVPSQIRQLFQNLMANSLKFVRDGVQPVITVSCKLITADEAVAYQLTKANNYLQLQFADNGIGFENEYAQKIFAIFQRLHGRSEYEGSGIGLAICKKIAVHHGGTIFATGQPYKGAIFTIILPA